jgi:S-(hydroxymethyl)glutathione dehydrogenase/alcohol dehydrogenase
MKAAVLREVRKPLQIEDVEIASPGPHEVRIRTAAAGVCHSDLHFQQGSYMTPMPIVLGHESAGIVEEVGSEVQYVKPGDHVITCLSVFCGHCSYCLSGRPNLCDKIETRRRPDQPPRLSQGGELIQQFADLSSYAEQMLVHEHAVVKIREDMPLDRAALIGCGVVTGAGAVLNTARVEAGSTVAVIGCGGVGLSAVQGAAIAGAGRIIAVDKVASKLELAKAFGATDGVNASEGDPVQQVQQLTGGGVDYSFEAIGLKQTAEQSFAMLARGGTATIIGMVPFGTNLEIPGHIDFFWFEKKLQGSNMGSNRFRVDMPRYVDFYLSGKLNLDDMISARIKLDEINSAFAALEKGEVARQVIVFEH